MKNIHKKFSVNLNKLLEPIIKENYGTCSIVEKESGLISFCDKENPSHFFFDITKETYDKSAGHIIHFTCKPHSVVITSARTPSAYKAEVFKDILKAWFENVKFYQQPSILNDPILNGYQEEFYEEYKIMDEDADYKGFAYDQQLAIVKFLENVVSTIDEVKDDNNTVLIEEIKSEAKEMQLSITSYSKNGFIQKFSKLFAKARKGGLRISNLMIKEFAKEFLKEGAKASFNFAVKHASALPEYLTLTINQLSQ